MTNSFSKQEKTPQYLYEVEGIPAEHTQAFLEVAKNNDCVIMSRTPGKACGQLLKENQDGKSFFIKSKSCNWGPMAGFVCLDPKMNKKKDEGALKNLKETYKSLVNTYEGNFATATPIFISESRLNWLLNYEKAKDGFNKISDSVYEYHEGRLNMVLVKNMETGLWGLFYDIRTFYNATGSNLTSDLVAACVQGFIPNNVTEKDKKKLGDVIDKFWRKLEAKGYLTSGGAKVAGSAYQHYVPVMGLVNPHPPFKGADAYKNAVTGDYDLYALWPKHPSEDDYRVAGMTQNTTDNDIIEGENHSSIGSVVGNISNRIYFIAQMVNSTIVGTKTGAQPNRIFHSDEGGRPFIDDVDSAAVFSPDGKTYMVEDAKDLAAAVEYFHSKGYTCFMNKGWLKDLKAVNPQIESKLAWNEKLS